MLECLQLSSCMNFFCKFYTHTHVRSQVITLFSHCSDQIPDKKKLGKGRFILVHSLRGTVHHGKEGVAAGASDWSHCVLSWETQRDINTDAHGLSPSPPFYSVWTPACRMVLPTF